MSRAASPSGAAGAARARSPGLVGSYLQRSELPLTSLLFVLPMLIIYEVGAHALPGSGGTYPELVAFQLMRQFFLFFGANGRYLPALAVVGILLTWHIARNDAWKVAPGTLVSMFVESVLLGVPLIFICVLMADWLPLSAPWQSKAIMSFGAGIYEELIFRLCAMTILSVLLTDLLKLKKGVAMALMVITPAILFSLYHYLGDEQFAVGSFLFRTVAGVYFGIIFLCRGFGITAGSHAAYDIWIVGLSAFYGR